MNTSKKAGRREWIGLAVIALPCILYSMDLTVLDLALPRITADLKPSAAQMLWIVDIYGFMVAGSLITMGTLGDRIGRRRLLMIGAGAFGVASVFAAFSRSASMLIAMRALLGIAGATLAPSTLSLIRNMFLDAKQRTVAIGVWATSYSLGGAIGPIAGGVLLEHFRWGSVFLAATPAMALLLVTAPLVLPEFKATTTARIDVLSVAESITAVLTMIYGLKQIAEGGARSTAFACIAAGALLAVIFVRRQRQLAEPLIDLRLFRTRAFNVPLIAYLLATFIAFGAFLFSAQYLQLVLGLSPLRAGWWLMPSFAGFIAGSMLAPPIAARVQRRLVMCGAMLVAAAGLALLTQISSGGVIVLAIGTFAYSLGLAPVVTLATDAIVGAAPAAHAGTASAISETSSEFGGALGIAILGSIGTAIYRSSIGEHVSGLVPADADAAKATLGGAVSIAGHLQLGASRDLIHAAREAFAQSYAVIAAICALLALITAAATLLVPERSEESDAPVVFSGESV